MTCDFTSFSTVFQSYQDNEKAIMEGYVQWSLFMAEKILTWAGLEPKAARLVGLGLTYWATWAPATTTSK